MDSASLKKGLASLMNMHLALLAMNIAGVQL